MIRLEPTSAIILHGISFMIFTAEVAPSLKVLFSNKREGIWFFLLLDKKDIFFANLHILNIQFQIYPFHSKRKRPSSTFVSFVSALKDNFSNCYVVFIPC